MHAVETTELQPQRRKATWTILSAKVSWAWIKKGPIFSHKLLLPAGEASLLQVQAKKGLHSVVGDGTRRKETEHFYTYMSRWWRLHRAYMQRHNSIQDGLTGLVSSKI